MSNSSGIIRIKKESESIFKYKFEDLKSNQRSLFEFIFRILNRAENHSSEWSFDDNLNNGYKLRIDVYTPNEIISQKNQKNQIPFGQEGLMGDIEKTPIIHLVLTDFLNDSLHSENEQLHPLIPRYFQIIDSNIWNHYVPMVKFDSSEDGFYFLFTNAVNEIYNNHEKGLYTLEVTSEYADINARILQQSYLIGHHGSGVAPFIFHSEGYIKKLINDEKLIDRICERKWRFLLVDDKSNAPMTSVNTVTVKEGCLDTKLKIIKNRLESIFTNSTEFQIFDETGQVDGKKCGILIESVSSIDEAKESLKKREYDIILLDYLLDKGKNGGYEYGYDLLNDIKKSIKDKSDKYLIGPRGCYFFMFISAYPSAVHDRLLAEGLNLHERYWHINAGTCPTNTPQLFLYNLLKFMHRRLERLGINRLSHKGIRDQILKIFEHPKDDKDRKTVREMADDQYRNVLRLQYHYRRMLKDVYLPKKGDNLYNIKGSVLVSDFIQQDDWLGGFLEHISHLIYLVAFGTARQWPEMWEEYLYIRPYLARIEESPSEVSTLIEDYISKLKQQQRWVKDTSLN